VVGVEPETSGSISRPPFYNLPKTRKPVDYLYSPLHYSNKCPTPTHDPQSGAIANPDLEFRSKDACRLLPSISPDMSASVTEPRVEDERMHAWNRAAGREIDREGSRPPPPQTSVPPHPAISLAFSSLPPLPLKAWGTVRTAEQSPHPFKGQPKASANYCVSAKPVRGRLSKTPEKYPVSR